MVIKNVLAKNKICSKKGRWKNFWIKRVAKSKDAETIHAENKDDKNFLAKKSS